MKRILLVTSLLAFAACSSPSSGGTGALTDAAGTKDASESVDVAGADAKADTAKTPDGADKDSALDDSAVEDTAATTDAAQLADATPDPDAAWDPDFSWDDPDAPATDVDLNKPVGQLYAQTSNTLYRLDAALNAFTLVGKFTFDKNSGSITDIALDQYGKLFAITNHDVFICAAGTAACKWLAALPGTGTFNGMTFVPKGTITANETLIGIGTDGSWNQIDVTGATATVTKLGSYGGSWLSSGDAFSVEGIGTYATLKTATSKTDTLAKVDPANGKILSIVGDTGVNQLFGLAWWNGVFYGVSNDGNIYTLDTTTGAATKVTGISTPTGVKWWGAGVSTRANGGT